MMNVVTLKNLITIASSVKQGREEDEDYEAVDHK